MLTIALWMFWTAVVVLAVSTMDRLTGQRFDARYQEALRVLDETPYLQRLGLRPPKKPVPWTVWGWGAIVWFTGCLFIAGNLPG